MPQVMILTRVLDVQFGLSLPAPLSSTNSAKQNLAFPRQGFLGTVKLRATVLSYEERRATSEDAHLTPPSDRLPWLRNALRRPCSARHLASFARRPISTYDR